MWRTKSRLAAPLGDAHDRAALTRLLRTRLPWFAGIPSDVSWATSMRFEHRASRPFGRLRAWLAGDAAHLGGPLGVQSMNAGLREAADLAFCLDEILHRRAPLGVLESYGARARAEWMRVADEPVAHLSADLAI